ncbi:hypothetical protein EC9_20520 [Rosistilla ulvae]|uniref:Uncharacterized protein n=1 Tax=Rosistilla ulvae TaxID=1930277 RepID=A0A517LZ42_9BACT|nr:hypothetical protein EC9_20520 [Rosistilla ulvae]
MDGDLEVESFHGRIDILTSTLLFRQRVVSFASIGLIRGPLNGLGLLPANSTNAREAN